MQQTGLVKRALVLFGQVCDLPPDEQRVYLDTHCDDDVLRARVEALLAQDELPDTFLDAEAPLATIAAVALEAEHGASMPSRLGPYEIVRQVGAGGMGVIYEALQESPRRRVALKVIRPGIGHHGLLSRFAREVQVLGQLQHPGIASIYEAGLADGNSGQQPYFAMEFIQGLPCDTYAAEQNLSVAQRLELMARVADAVQHAHQKGIMHRDLKPANVLVSVSRTGDDEQHSDAIGQPKVLDFGIARMTDADVHNATLQTEVGQIVGTLAYMSPEQVEGNSADLDTRCDVYALGVMLYELLAGKTPFATKTSMLEVARAIREDTPQRLSAVRPELRGDVETIVNKAMAKDRTQRYSSAAELAADMRRYLAQEPIEARPATALYVISRFARRNRGFVATLAGALAMLIVALIALAFGLVQADARRAVAVAANEQLQSVVAYQSAMLENIDVAEMGDEIVTSLRQEARKKLNGDAPALVQQRDAFEQVLSLVNPTTVANHALDTSLMAPAAATLDREFTEQPALRATLRGTLASIYERIGLARKALDQARRSLQTLEEADAPAEERLKVQQQICRLLLELGAYDEAEREVRAVLASSRKILGPAHIQTLVTQRLLGSVLLQLTRPEESEVEIRAAIEGLQQAAGPLHEETLQTRQMLGQFYKKQRRNDEAKDVYQQLLQDAETHLGSDHPITLEVLLSKANLHFTLSEYDTAAQLFQRVCTARLEALGADHPDTLRARRELTNALSELGHYDQAEPILLDTLRRQRERLGSDHPSTVSTLSAALRLQIKRQRWAEAEAHGLEAYAIAQRTLGDDNARTASAIADVFIVYHKSGQYDLADEWGQRMLTSYRHVHGPEDMRVFTAQQFIAKSLIANGKWERAERLLTDTLEAAERLFPSSSLVAGTLGQLVNVRIGLGRGAEAEAAARKLLAWCEERGAGAGTIAKCKLWLGRTLLAQQAPEAAASLIADSLREFPATDTPSWSLLFARLLEPLIAMQRDGQDRVGDIQAAYQQLIESRLQFYPEEHAIVLPEVHELMQQLGIDTEAQASSDATP